MLGANGVQLWYASFITQNVDTTYMSSGGYYPYLLIGFSISQLSTSPCAFEAARKQLTLLGPRSVSENAIRTKELWITV